jgi:hypothetical protein
MEPLSCAKPGIDLTIKNQMPVHASSSPIRSAFRLISIHVSGNIMLLA